MNNITTYKIDRDKVAIEIYIRVNPYRQLKSKCRGYFRPHVSGEVSTNSNDVMKKSDSKINNEDVINFNLSGLKNSLQNITSSC